MAVDFTKAAQTVSKSLNVKNVQAVPTITRVVVNVGVGKRRDDKSYLKAVVDDLLLLTGQYPQERRARKAVAGFNVREGNLVGYRVTLRGKRMEDFVRRLVDLALPRVRDFRGLALTSLDGHGNLSIGLEEHLPFPEINPEKTDVTFGLQVTLVTSASNDVEGETLFKALHFPLTVPEAVE